MQLAQGRPGQAGVAHPGRSVSVAAPWLLAATPITRSDLFSAFLGQSNTHEALLCCSVWPTDDHQSAQQLLRLTQHTMLTNECRFPVLLRILRVRSAQKSV